MFKISQIPDVEYLNQYKYLKNAGNTLESVAWVQ